VSGLPVRSTADRPTLGEALETALAAVHYSGQLQRSSEGGYQDFQDWGWAFVELVETLYSVNRALDRQAIEHAGTSQDDGERLRQMRRHLAMLNVALAEAGAHARGFYDLASRLGTRAENPAMER
jgi:hypothetical protein